MTASIKKQILFVDDEMMVLKGLQRTLRVMRDHWDMAFVSDGEAALRHLAEHPCDVIVTDMRMPKMDGANLLAEVKRRHPHVIRIIFSGQLDRKMTLQSVQVAHQHLLKPCDVTVLRSTLAQTFALNSVLENPKIRKVIARIDALPSIPSLYSELMEEMHASSPSIDKVGRIISQDVAMSSKILQLVNSAFFGLYRKISSPKEAVMLLGMETIKALVLSVKIFSQFDRKKLSFLNLDALWNHSLSTSVQAKSIGHHEQFSKEQTGDTFMAGLLHDVGKMVLASNFSNTYQQILIKAHQSSYALWQVEKAVFGTTHAEVGAYLMGLWGIEQAIIEAIAFHHQPSKSRVAGKGPLLAVHISNALQNKALDTIEDSSSSTTYDQTFLDKLKLQGHISDWEELCLQSM